MSRVDKTVAKWKNIPTAVEKEEVFRLLLRFGFKIEAKRGSHNIVSHEKLAGCPNFGLRGEFCLPLENGRKVRGARLKTVLKAIEIVQENETT